MMRDGYTADLPDCPSCTHLCTLFDLQWTLKRRSFTGGRRGRAVPVVAWFAVLGKLVKEDERA